MGGHKYMCTYCIGIFPSKQWEKHSKHLPCWYKEYPSIYRYYNTWQASVDKQVKCPYCHTTMLIRDIKEI